MSQLSLVEFADKIGAVFPVVIKEFLKRQTCELSRGKITMPQFLILNFLHKQGEGRMTDLAKFMGVTTAAMTGIVDRMVRDRYVERILEPEDRRIIKVRATARAAALVKKVNVHQRQMIIDIFGRLTQRDREEYLRIILQMRDVLTTQKA